jgi:glyoxylase-like metal-dependent hydrolase (beta-lactamase superfamily II)
VVTVDLLFTGLPLRTLNYGSLAFASIPLIRAGGKSIVVDTGGPGMHRPLLARLAERGVAPTDVHMLLLSHGHWDHCLGAPLFPNAEIVIAQAELEWALAQVPHENPAVSGHLLRQLAEGSRLRTIKGDTQILPGLSMIETPGHTPGHMAVLAETAQGRIVIAQDALKNRVELLKRVGEMIVDAAASTASIERIVALADLIVPGHDRPLRVEGGRPVYQAEASVEILARVSPEDEDQTVFSIRLR